MIDASVIMDNKVSRPADRTARHIGMLILRTLTQP